jgi:Mg-chelatase subunit ChlD
LFDASGGGAVSRAVGPERQAPGPANAPSGGAPGQTDENGQLAALERDGPLDRQVKSEIQEIAARLSLPRPRRRDSVRGAGGELRSRPYRGDSDEIDLDATLSALIEHPIPSNEDVIVQERVRTRRSVALLVDVSGSMRGERIRTVAATVAALAAELDHDHLAIVAFWSDAAVLQRLGVRRGSLQLLDEMLRIPARGLTNLEFPLRVAARELAGTRNRDVRAILVSDCVHNAGPDPRPAAAALARLDVLFDISGEQDAELARDLAHSGRGRIAAIRTYRDVAAGVSRFFSD